MVYTRVYVRVHGRRPRGENAARPPRPLTCVIFARGGNPAGRSGGARFIEGPSNNTPPYICTQPPRYRHHHHYYSPYTYIYIYILYIYYALRRSSVVSGNETLQHRPSTWSNSTCKDLSTLIHTNTVLLHIHIIYIHRFPLINPGCYLLHNIRTSDITQYVYARIIIITCHVLILSHVYSGIYDPVGSCEFVKYIFIHTPVRTLLYAHRCARIAHEYSTYTKTIERFFYFLLSFQ